MEVGDAVEDAALEPLLGQFGEEPFDGIEPGGRGRSEVEMEPPMPLEDYLGPRQTAGPGPGPLPEIMVCFESLFQQGRDRICPDRLQRRERHRISQALSRKEC